MREPIIRQRSFNYLWKGDRRYWGFRLMSYRRAVGFQTALHWEEPSEKVLQIADCNYVGTNQWKIPIPIHWRHSLGHIY